MINSRTSPLQEKNPVESFLYRFIPYWPLFTLLVVIAGAAAIFYVKFVAKSQYEISAKLLVEDQKKGVDESKILEALNISSNTIVDNEIEVIQSKQLLKQVVDSLHLNAPVYTKGTFTDYSAYTSSPITIKIISKNENSLITDIPFTYNIAKKQVGIDGKWYNLNTTANTAYGNLVFMPNKYYHGQAITAPMFFRLKEKSEMVDNLYASILITPASKLSSVILMSYTDEVPKRGEDILNGLITAYHQSGVSSKNNVAKSTLSFVQDRIQSVAHELDSIESRLRNFKHQNGAVDLGEQSKMYLQNVGDNDRKVTDIDMQLAMLNEVEHYVQNKDDEIGVVPSMPGLKEQTILSDLVTRLYQSQIQYERMKKTVPAGNPTMYSLKNEIDNMRPAILENIKNQRSSLVAGRSSLNTGTGRFVSMLNAIPGKEKELLEISRQQAIKNDAYSFLLQKREEAALAYSSLLNNGETISAATASFTPVAPKKTFVFAASIVLALLAGFGFVTIKESGSNKVLFRSDIEKITRIPIVGEITRISRKPVLLSDGGNKDHLLGMEQFRQLRFALGLTSRVQQYRKLLVTSSEAAEGKSFISDNLALSMVSCGRSVVIVDFDFRKPKTTSIFNLQGKMGLSDYFDNDNVLVEDIIYPTAYDKLFVIPAGNISDNPSELLLKRDLDMLFGFLESKFDLVVMDTAPVDPVVDASVISEYCDAILFVVRHGHTSKPTLEALNKSQKLNAFKNMFIVFNDVKSRGFLNHKYGFGYGYGISRLYGKEMYQLGNVGNSKMLPRKVS